MSQRFNILIIMMFMTILNNRVKTGKVSCPRVRKNTDSLAACICYTVYISEETASEGLWAQSLVWEDPTCCLWSN